MEHLSRRIAVMVMSLGLLGGCAKSEPSRFYVLDAGVGLDSLASGTTTREGPAIGVGPLVLPQYLDRPQIVTRSGANALDLGEFDQWAGRLGEDITRVLAEQLSERLATDRVSIFPWSGATQIDYQVILQVLTFEADAAGTSHLDVRWEVIETAGQQRRLAARSRLNAPAPPAGDSPRTPADYRAIVASMSQNLATLAGDIADRLNNL